MDYEKLYDETYFICIICTQKTVGRYEFKHTLNAYRIVVQIWLIGSFYLGFLTYVEESLVNTY